MRRHDALRAAVTAAAAGFAGCSLGDDGPDFHEGVEDGMDGWETDAAIGPEVDVAEFEYEIAVADEEAAAGERSLRIWNEGDYNDGVSWPSTPSTSTATGRTTSR